MFEEVRAGAAEAKAQGLAVVIWAYPRGGSLSHEGETAIDVVAYVVASGSLLPGIAEDFYARLGDLVRGNNARLILDTHGAALKRGLIGRPFLIRLNQLEAEELAAENSPPSSPADIAAQLVATGATEVAVFAMGERGSLVTT